MDQWRWIVGGKGVKLCRTVHTVQCRCTTMHYYSKQTACPECVFACVCCRCPTIRTKLILRSASASWFSSFSTWDFVSLSLALQRQSWLSKCRFKVVCDFRFLRPPFSVQGEWHWQRKVVKTVQQHCLFVSRCIGSDYLVDCSLLCAL